MVWEKCNMWVQRAWRPVYLSTKRIGRRVNFGLLFVTLVSLAIPVFASTPTLKVSSAQYTLTVTPGSKTTDVLTFATGSFGGNITLAVSGLPSGVTASWSANPITPSAGAASSVLTLTASPTAALGSVTLTVTASGDGPTVSTNCTLRVPGLAFQDWVTSVPMPSTGKTTVNMRANTLGGVTTQSGGAGATATIISGLPTGIAASWSQLSSGASGVEWALTLAGSTTAVASTGTLNILFQIKDASSGAIYSTTATLPLAVTLTPPTLNFLPAVGVLSLMQSTSASDAFTFTAGGSFHGKITLAVAGLPSGVTASWSANPVTPSAGVASSILTLTASPTAAKSGLQYTVTATGDGVTRSNSYTVEVEPTVGEQLQLAQSTVSIQPQATATLSVTAAGINGVHVPSNLSGVSATVVSGLPSGITASWSSPAFTSASAANWTLTLTTDGTAPAGSDQIKLTTQITDASSGAVYTASSSFSLLVSLLATAAIGNTPGNTISADFMGLSHEWGGAQRMMGSSATGTNPIYRQLLNNLVAYGSGPINIRIGGNSTDTTVEPTPTSVLAFAQLATDVHAEFELGVNLGSDDVTMATAQAKSYVSQMPSGSIRAIEIGNEPDVYSSNSLRQTTYTLQDYYADFSTWAGSILPVLPSGTKLMGPSWAGTGMLTDLPSFESQFATDMSIVSQHFYAGNSVHNLAPDYLLTPQVAALELSTIEPAVTANHEYGIPFRIGELNSIAVAGEEGVSDTFCAALWSTDLMFEYANIGVDGVNWETSSGNLYYPFAFTSTTSNGIASYALSSVAPLYYGLLLFQAATGNHAALLPVALNTTANLKAWATVDASGTPRLVVINKDEGSEGNVQISLPGYSQAAVIRLTAPSFTSVSGVTFGGQTFDTSTNGTIQGSETSETINSTNGVFQLPMSVTSAALVTFTH